MRAMSAPVPSQPPGACANIVSRRFCVAPMMDVTDRHCRFFLRLLSTHALLYSEMVSTGALLHGDCTRLLKHDPAEQPLALQLGGSDPLELAACARLGADAGFREINLNVGCPSDRVQHHRIGACLMAEPQLVGDCIARMRDAVTIPVTVKCRTGIDAMDSFGELASFIDEVAKRGGCRTFIVHARIAVLSGLSPRENREIPPLNHARVHALKRYFPELEIIINGGLQTLAACEEHLRHVDGVMLGREAYRNPWLLHDVDARLFGTAPRFDSRHDILERFLPYVEAQIAEGVALHHMTRHILGLFQGQPGGKRFRRHLSEHAHRAGAGPEVLRAARKLALAQPVTNNRIAC
jgi:tRNA-dihydrouridine synthase A